MKSKNLPSLTINQAYTDKIQFSLDLHKLKRLICGKEGEMDPSLYGG